LEFNAIKGFKDILPEEVENWQYLDLAFRRLFNAFGFHEIKTPLLEKNEVFSRSIGQDTDIVSKEMYSLQDTRGQVITLRPEATASVVRAYIQHRLYEKNPVQKLYSIGPMFRRERPQKGRFRQFYQINAELIGDPGPKSDADIIAMAVYLFETIGLGGLILNLNSLGCPICRSDFRDELKEYLEQKKGLLCEDCQRRSETNPLRVFDCKLDECRNIVSDAPSILEFLCANCKEHFESLQRYLKSLNITYILNHKLVRGLDYYTRTTFEIQTEQLGAQNAIAGGGRYDGLVNLLGGPDHPAIGFAIGVERVIALLEEKKLMQMKTPDLFIAALGEPAEIISFNWIMDLRKSGIRVETDYGAKSLKAQMKRADRLGAKNVLIIGDDELASSKAVFRNMATKEQQELNIENILDNIRKVLNYDGK